MTGRHGHPTADLTLPHHEDYVGRLIGASLRHRSLVLVLTAVVAAVGLFSAARLPLDAVPDLTNVQVQLNTLVPALAPEEVEQTVTFPIEAELGGVPGMVESRSLSRNGLSQVTLVFEDGTDLYRARQLVAERLRSLGDALPAGVIPVMGPISTGLGEIVHYEVAATRPRAGESEVERLMRLSRIHEWTVKPMLRTVSGVAEVNAIGGYETQLQILADPGRLERAGASFSELAEAVAASNQNAGGGFIQREGHQTLVRTLGRMASVEDVLGVPVRLSSFNRPLAIRDVAEVCLGPDPLRSGVAVVDGHEAVIGTAMMVMGRNSRDVARAVIRRIEDVNAALPADVTVRPLYSREELVNRTLRTVRNNLLEGAALVVLVLVALLGDLRASLLVAAVIPLAMLVAATGMAWFGISGNLMSLGAIDFGLIVDTAVIVVESCVRRLASRARRQRRILLPADVREAVAGGAMDVSRAASIGGLIILLVYLPVFALGGIERKMFMPMAATVVLALTGAILLSFTVIPVLASLVLRAGRTPHRSRAMEVLDLLYRPALPWALRHGRAVLAIVAILGLAAAWTFTRLGGEFMPPLDEGAFALELRRPMDLGPDGAVAMEKKAERVTGSFPEVSHVFGRLGTAEVASDPMPVSGGDSYIMLRPRGEWPRTHGHRRTREELVQAMRAGLERAVPSQVNLFSMPIKMRFDELLEGTRAPLTVKIFGPDFDVLNRTGGRIKELLEQMPGVGEIEFEELGKAPMIEVVMNREAMEQYGVRVADVNDAVGAGLAGREAGRLYRDAEPPVPIVIRLPERFRSSPETIARLPVRAESGGTLPLGRVAAIRKVEQVSTIFREGGRRRIALLLEVEGQDMAGFVKEAKQRVASAVTLPPGYRVEWGGQYKNLIAARNRLAVIVPLVLAAIFAMIFLALRRLRLVAIVFAGVPFAAVGGVFALAARGMPMTVTAGIGFIAVSGVAVLDSLVMVTSISDLVAAGRTARRGVVEGALTRLRPVLMTALVASLGFIPMALATGMGAEVQRPLATVVIGGIVSSTLLTLLVVPVLFEWIGPKHRRA